MDTPGWDTKQRDRYGPIHVVPLEDYIDHAESADCPCAPRVIEVTCSAGQPHFTLAHNAFDGRA